MQRADIIRAAAQIFRQKGYHAASMQDIANSVNLRKPSLYHHVESKQDILLTILNKALDLLIGDLQVVVDSDLSPDEKLRQAMRVYIERLTEDTDLAAVLLLEYRSLESELRARHNARRDRYEGLWRQILEEGMKSGAFNTMDVSVSAFALLGVQNWLITWYKEGGRYKARELADQFCDLFLEGLRVPKEVEVS